MPGTTSPRNYPYPLDADPIDVAGDIQALAEAVDNDVASLYLATQRKGFEARRATTQQSVANNTTTTVAFDTLIEEVNGDFVPPPNISTFTIPEAGIYAISAIIYFATSATGAVTGVVIQQTAGPVSTQQLGSNVGPQYNGSISVGMTVRQVGGEQYVIHCFQSSGAAIGMNARLAVWRVAP